MRAGEFAPQSGFSIVEVLVAIVVLAIGILATATVFASSDSTTLDSELQQVATAKAESVLEEVRALPYGQVGHAQTPTEQPPGEDRYSTLPSGRYAFTPPDAEAEEVVYDPNSEGGDSSGGVILSGPNEGAQAQHFEIDPGGGAAPVEGDVYTFVTWRNESCELLDADELSPIFADLRQELALRQGEAQDLLDTLNDANAPLPPDLRALRDTYVPPLIDSLAQAVADLDALSLVDIDLCDLPDEALAALTDIVTGTASAPGTGYPYDPSLELHADINNTVIIDLQADIGAAQDALDGVAVFLSGVVGFACPPSGLIPQPLRGLLQQVCDTASALTTQLTSPQGAQSVIDDLNGDIGTLNGFLADPDTTHNTKRVTVGVVIDTGRTDVGPQNAVWLSTVVTNPTDGLLGIGT